MNGRPIFSNRYRISGTLQLTSDLYLSDGDSREEPREGGSTQIATVVRAVDNRPVIPGAALKGVLRHYLEASRAPQNLIERVFGKAPVTQTINQDLTPEDLGAGGNVEFFYATLNTANFPPAGVQQTAGWNASRGTGTAAFVGIDRVTRTAADRLLYAADYVPRGTVFDVEIVGYNLDDADLGLLLRALEGFNNDTIRLGAKQSNSCGRAEWNPTSIARIGSTELTTWYHTESPGPGWADFPAADDWPLHVRRAEQALQASSLSSPPRLTVTVVLRFDGPFLVNDPSRAGNNNYTPRLTPSGTLLLPASAARGAFRSQAERIARTLDKHAIDPHEPSQRDNTQSEFTRLFGATGRAAAIVFEDFTTTASITWGDKTFVAIDRFTGGSAQMKRGAGTSDSAEGKLYGARYALDPVMQGRVHLNLLSISPAIFGLLALTVRDWCEGDISFGFGSASRGFGRCTAQILDNWDVHGLDTLAEDQGWAEVFAIAGLRPDDYATIQDSTVLAAVITECVDRYRMSEPADESEENLP